MDAPLDQSLVDLLRQSAVGPMFDRPVSDVLREMGLPQLPDLSALPPLPEMPPLPLLDLSGLMQPITNLVGSFGTGVLPSATPTQDAAQTNGDGAATETKATDTALDPAELLSQVSTGLQTAMTLGSSVLQMVMSLWQGMGADSAGEKSGQASKDTAAVASQSAATSAGVVNASGTVFRGATQMSAIMAKYMASVVAAGPFIATPPGQAFLLASTTETLAEALTVVGITRGELTVHSGEMSATGQKVPVTNAPTGVDSSQIMTQLMSILPTLATTATSGIKTISDAYTAMNPTETEDDSKKETGEIPEGELGTPVLGGVGGAAGAIAAARPLAEWGGGRQGNSALGTAAAAAPVSSAGANTGGGMRSSTMAGGPGMMPMGAGAMSGARATDEAADGLRTHLVTEQHGDEVVGEIDRAAMPVVGAAKPAADAATDDRPDQALAL